MTERTPNLLAFRQGAMTAAAVLFSCFLALPAAAQERRQVPEFRTYGSPASPAAAGAIDSFVRDYKSAWAQEDTDGLISLHTEDTEWINAYARMFQGADALREFLAEKLFPEFDDAIAEREAENMKLISIRYMGADAAVVHMYTESPRGPSRNPGEKLRRTHIHLVLEKKAPGWKIAHTAIMDAR